MQKYHPKTAAAEVSDRLLRALTASAAGVGWFVYLWGLSLPSLTAGLALGAMLWLCARQFSKQAHNSRSFLPVSIKFQLLAYHGNPGKSISVAS